jgi:hypothetical protein
VWAGVVIVVVAVGVGREWQVGRELRCGEEGGTGESIGGKYGQQERGVMR